MRNQLNYDARQYRVTAKYGRVFKYKLRAAATVVHISILKREASEREARVHNIIEYCVCLALPAIFPVTADR